MCSSSSSSSSSRAFGELCGDFISPLLLPEPILLHQLQTSLEMNCTWRVTADKAIEQLFFLYCPRDTTKGINCFTHPEYEGLPGLGINLNQAPEYRLQSGPENPFYLLSFETFLPQWMKKKFPTSPDKPPRKFTVHVQKTQNPGKYGFTIIAWGELNGSACILAVCYASYFTCEHAHEANRNLAYIEKTESVGLSDLLKNYVDYAYDGSIVDGSILRDKESITIAMKAAFAEYVSICGSRVHLWAYPAAVEADEMIHDLILIGSSNNRTAKIQQRTQTDLLNIYKNGYNNFGIAHEAYQVAFTEPSINPIPHFVTDGDLDTLQAQFDGAAGGKIDEMVDTMKKSIEDLCRQQREINTILENSTLVLTSKYTTSTFTEYNNKSMVLLFAPTTHDDSLLEFIKQHPFDGTPNVIKSSSKILDHLKSLKVNMIVV